MLSAMNFDKKLLPGTFLKRYKRFFADVQLENGEIITAHCPNTGSMKGLLAEGATAWVAHHNDPKRKLQYTLELLGAGDSLVGVNTARPNKIVAHHIAAGNVPELAGYANLRGEVKYGTNSRIDLLLEDANKPACYVEIKNTTLREGGAALFPDAVTSRGLKHLEELAAEVKKGNRAVMFYLVNRDDCSHFSPADDIDPAYGEALRRVVQQGVEILSYACDVTPEKIHLSRKLDVTL